MYFSGHPNLASTFHKVSQLMESNNLVRSMKAIYRVLGDGFNGGIYHSQFMGYKYIKVLLPSSLDIFINLSIEPSCNCRKAGP